MLTEAEIKLLTAMTWRTARKLGYDIERQSVAPVMRAVSQIAGRRDQAAASAKFTFLELRELTVPARAIAGEASLTSDCSLIGRATLTWHAARRVRGERC